jgi:hypothetical protein
MINHFRILRLMRARHERLHRVFLGGLPFHRCETCRVAWTAAKLAAGLAEGENLTHCLEKKGVCKRATSPQGDTEPS